MDQQLEQDYEKQTHAPFIDSLTGLFNHGFFQACLDWEIKKSQRYGEPLTLAFIDVDSYASYNKQHGPMQGDRVLRELAGLIRENIRQSDLAARYANDRFAVLLTRSDNLFSSMERIRAAVREAYRGELTVSVGIASFPQDAANKECLIKKAQDALFQAKIRGKNKLYFYKKEETPSDIQKPKVLVVDDKQLNIMLLEHMLLPLNYEVFQAHSGEEALYIVNNVDIDLVLLDILMPGLDGYEVCRRLKEGEATRLIPVIMVTSLDETEAKIKGIEAGADDFIHKPLNRVELLARTRSLIKVKTLNSNLISIEDVLISLANMVEAKDAYTQGHIQRVSSMAVDLGKRMGLSARENEAIRLGGILHDIGKIAIPGHILNKPGPLDAKEWEIMKSHADIGYKMCLPLKRTLGPALEAIRHHHEKLDGSGYPDALKGDDISLASRIMCVADIYDALLTDRPYRKGMPKQEAFAILFKEADQGKLDKSVVVCLWKMTGGSNCRLA
ncbi:MAG: HD domain-containing phosphohydrolase [bacterium]